MRARTVLYEMSYLIDHKQILLKPFFDELHQLKLIHKCTLMNIHEPITTNKNRCENLQKSSFGHFNNFD